MSRNKLTLIFLLNFFVLTYSAQQSSRVKVKLKIEFKSVENFGKPLNNTINYIYSDGQFIDSVYCKKRTMNYLLEGAHLFKIEFSKNGYVNKYVIINTKDIPSNSKKRIKLKADINLFRKMDRINVEFLKTEPVSIAYYNFIKKSLIWDYDYNRSVVEKIIDASLKK